MVTNMEFSPIKNAKEQLDDIQHSIDARRELDKKTSVGDLKDQAMEENIYRTELEKLEKEGITISGASYSKFKIYADINKGDKKFHLRISTVGGDFTGTINGELISTEKAKALHNRYAQAIEAKEIIESSYTPDLAEARENLKKAEDMADEKTAELADELL